VVVQLCSCAVMQSCGREVVRSCSLAVLQSCGLAVVRSCGRAVVQSGEVVRCRLVPVMRHPSLYLTSCPIIDALAKTSYNRTTAAQLLKISRKTLFNKMKMYDLWESGKVEK